MYTPPSGERPVRPSAVRSRRKPTNENRLTMLQVRYTPLFSAYIHSFVHFKVYYSDKVTVKDYQRLNFRASIIPFQFFGYFALLY